MMKECDVGSVIFKTVLFFQKKKSHFQKRARTSRAHRACVRTYTYTCVRARARAHERSAVFTLENLPPLLDITIKIRH